MGSKSCETGKEDIQVSKKKKRIVNGRSPYSTISKQAADSHKSITFLSYQPDSLVSGVSSTQSHQEESRTETTLMSHSYQEETSRTVSDSYQEEIRVETAFATSSSEGAEAFKEEQQRTVEQDEEKQPLSLSEIKLEVGEAERG